MIDLGKNKEVMDVLKIETEFSSKKDLKKIDITFRFVGLN